MLVQEFKLAYRLKPYPIMWHCWMVMTLRLLRGRLKKNSLLSEKKKTAYREAKKKNHMYCGRMQRVGSFDAQKCDCIISNIYRCSSDHSLWHHSNYQVNTKGHIQWQQIISYCGTETSLNDWAETPLLSVPFPALRAERLHWVETNQAIYLCL